MNRNAIYSAILDIAWAAYPWQNAKAQARRLLLWGDVPLENRPAIFLFEGGDERHSWPNSVNPDRTLGAILVIYTNAKDETLPGSVQINDILDALETAFKPGARDTMMGGKLTLNGLVNSCRIEGPVFKDPGDLDGDGMIRVPISIIVP